MRLFILGFSVLFFFALSAQDTLPNPGFEQWTYNPAGGGSHRPAGWNTYNPLTATLSKFTAFRADSAEARSGSYAIKLVSKRMTPSNFAPAVVTTGTISPSAGGIINGQPMSSRPDAVTGWYKYFPVNNDQALLEVFAFHAGQEIGSAALNISDSVTAWTAFTLPIAYTSTQTPDTIRVSFFASQGDASPPSEENSTLYIDDVAYDFTSGITPKEAQPLLRLQPNPADEVITLSVDHPLRSVAIFSLDGRQVKTVAASGTHAVIRIDELLPGSYLLTAYGENGAPRSGFFEVKK